MTRIARALLLAVAAPLAIAAPAGAQTATSALNEAAEALRSGDTVYVDPDARDVLSAEDERDVEAQIADEDARVFVAVLPEGAGTGNLAGQIGDEVRVGGTYVAVAGDAWSAASSELDRGEASELIREAAQGNADDAAAVLEAFVPEVAEASGGGPGTGWLAVLAAALAGGGLLAWRSAKRRRAREAAELGELRATAHDELSAIGDDVRALELDVDMPGADPRAKERYNDAVGAYVRAEEALDLARRPADFKPIGEALEEGRWDMAAARARLAGQEEPERRPPCFFDPRHGPSVADVEWQPELGEPREVPVCAADAARLEAGEEPTSREVTVGGQRMPYWQAPGHYAPFYAGGMFAGIGPGLLFGSVIGAGWDTGDGGGGGDSGWGGGDFGGGSDWGGGDFGGGDFGG